MGENIRVCLQHWAWDEVISKKMGGVTELLEVPSTCGGYLPVDRKTFWEYICDELRAFFDYIRSKRFKMLRKPTIELVSKEGTLLWRYSGLKTVCCTGRKKMYLLPGKLLRRITQTWRVWNNTREGKEERKWKAEIKNGGREIGQLGGTCFGVVPR